MNITTTTDKALFFVVFFVAGFILGGFFVYGIMTALETPTEPEPVIDTPVEIIIKNDTAVIKPQIKEQ